MYDYWVDYVVDVVDGCIGYDSDGVGLWVEFDFVDVVVVGLCWIVYGVCVVD